MNPKEERASTILIVDDDPVIREIIETIVKVLGYTVKGCGDGLEAVALLQDAGYDVVITDMMMPKMDGMQLLKHVKAHYPATDVVVVTGHSDTFIYSNIINAGGTDFISKPFEGDELEAKLNRVFRERKLIHGLEREIAERREAEAKLLRAKEEVDSANQTKDLMINDLYATMDEMLGNRDHYTFEHALRVAEISKRIGAVLGMAADEIEVMERACLVHDIGKVAIPDDVLLKPGQFDKEDREIMKVHPEVGANLFSRKHHDPRIAFVIRHHHERLDGSGYPDGLGAAALGAMVRIVSVADVYEALVARRPYKRPMVKDDALAILRMEASEGRLDGRIIEVLSDVLVGWDPLDITRELAADYMMDLEIFRRKTYFREPLSDFYNYRYLTFLADAKLLGAQKRPFHLMVTNFSDMSDFYKKMGHTITDQILDEIGQKLHDSVDAFNSECDPTSCFAQMFRKGADYLFYVESTEKGFDSLEEVVLAHLQKAEQEWRLVSHPETLQFERGTSVEKALNKIFQG